MNRFLICLLLCSATTAFASNPNGGIDAKMMERLRASYQNSPSDKAISNALRATDIDVLATNADNKNNFDDNFTHRVKSKGITNQKSSGRCWLFTGLNTLRSQMMEQHNLPSLELSQNYNFFFDQLEKSNLFLQEIINTANLPMDDRKVEFLFKNPVSDGGQFTGLSDNLLKYGVVPKSAMVETYSSSATSKLGRSLRRKLREDGMKLRRMKADGASTNELEAAKEHMLSEVYRMLALTLGVPPTEFTWTRKDKDGKVVSTKTYTPQSFYKEFAGNDLQNNYVMLMNDPTREYYKLYEIDLDRHVYDGKNWTYINLPVEDIKAMAIESIKDGKMMYFSCDVNKFLDRENGTLDLNNYDYDSLFGVKFGMDKADRIRTFDSSSSHAMTLVAVDLDDAGKPKKWLVENSWGTGANDGHLIMTDNWFDEYMFRLVVDKKYVPANILSILKQQPTLLPPTDPMFLPDE
ncbi:MAG: C1 family peptidase [Muribaculaceae bacterium]|nr:C1 family peptidase [Muribaculaceae bacterium]